MKSTRRCIAGLIGTILLFGTACSGPTPAARVDGVAGVSSSSKESVAVSSEANRSDRAGIEAQLQLAQQAGAEAVAKAAKQLASKRGIGRSSGEAQTPPKEIKGEAAQYETALRQILPAVRRSVQESVDN
jgi:hypothetical protein